VRVQAEYELRVQRLDREMGRVRDDGKQIVDRYEKELRNKIEAQQDRLDQEMRGEFEKEKAEFHKNETEKSETY
jgi:hypothetical protein